MKLQSLIFCVLVVSLAGCAGNPLKPDRPDGKRIPVNVTPPPVYMPATTEPSAPITDGDNAHSAMPADRKGSKHG